MFLWERSQKKLMTLSKFGNKIENWHSGYLCFLIIKKLLFIYCMFYSLCLLVDNKKVTHQKCLLLKKLTETKSTRTWFFLCLTFWAFFFELDLLLWKKITHWLYILFNQVIFCLLLWKIKKIQKTKKPPPKSRTGVLPRGTFGCSFDATAWKKYL